MLLNGKQLTNCYSVFRIDLNLRLSFFEVSNSNVNILNTLCQFSLKIAMYYRKRLFYFFFHFFLKFKFLVFKIMQKTKVYALEDSLGVDLCVAV